MERTPQAAQKATSQPPKKVEESKTREKQAKPAAKAVNSNAKVADVKDAPKGKQSNKFEESKTSDVAE